MPRNTNYGLFPAHVNTRFRNTKSRNSRKNHIHVLESHFLPFDLSNSGDWFRKQTSITGAEFYQYAVHLAHRYGWTFGGEIAGHLIGEFPHERLDPGNY